MTGLRMDTEAHSLRICLLSPYYGGSHRRWADEYKRHSAHEVTILSLPPRHWKWRMHGAAVTFAGMLARAGSSFDLILADEMMDVAVFISLIRSEGIQTPVATYFHENQITYPVSPDDTDAPAGRDLHYGFINYTSALASRAVFFNSDYHRLAFTGALEAFLKRYPDHGNLETVEQIRQKSRTLSLAMDLSALQSAKPDMPGQRSEPLILWNHRWEYDKCPKVFLEMLLALKKRGVPFRLALLGDKQEEADPVIQDMVRRLDDRIVHRGKVERSSDYASWLWRADILPVTAIQDFFGGSVVEAVYCGCHPVLPKRLAYPGHFPGAEVFYEGLDEAVEKVETLIGSGAWKAPCPLADLVSQYDWSVMAPVYDAAVRQIT